MHREVKYLDPCGTAGQGPSLDSSEALRLQSLPRACHFTSVATGSTSSSFTCSAAEAMNCPSLWVSFFLSNFVSSFGCAGSLLHHGLVSRGAGASCGGLSCCRARAAGLSASVAVAPRLYSAGSVVVA